MTGRRAVRRVGTFAAVVAFVSACAASVGAPGRPSTAPGRSAAPAAQSEASSASAPVAGAAGLTVYAAASLRDVLADIQTAYAGVTPDVTLTIATDASSTLRTQIEQGAPADVFLSADAKNAQALTDAGLADGDPTDFAGTLLTVIVPSDNPAGITTPRDLARPGLAVIAAGLEVPISTYVTQVVDNLGSQVGYPADFGDAYAANVVSREANVRAVVAKIELGEGDAAIVYATDVTSGSGVRRIDIPAEANVPATFAGVIVKASKHPAEARAFLDWLTGPEAQAIFARFGFRPPT